MNDYKVWGQTFINLYKYASKSHLKISSDFWNYFMKAREMAQQVKALLLWRIQVQFLALTLWLTTISNFQGIKQLLLASKDTRCDRKHACMQNTHTQS